MVHFPLDCSEYLPARSISPLSSCSISNGNDKLVGERLDVIEAVSILQHFRTLRTLGNAAVSKGYPPAAHDKRCILKYIL
jgi:hypothetical protein